MTRRLTYAAVFVAVAWASLTYGIIHTVCTDTGPDW